jgi:hypothetical protein
VRPAGPRSHPPAKPGGRGHARHRKPSARCSATRPGRHRRGDRCRPGRPRAARFPASGWRMPRRWKRTHRRAGAAVLAGLLGVCGSLRGKAIAPLSECRRHSTYRMGGSCPAVAPSCPPLPGQPVPGHRPPNVWLLGLTMSQQERCPGFTYCDQTSAEGAQSRLSFGAAVESWRVRLLCVQIRSICPHARPRAPRSGPAAGIGTGSSTGYPAP